MSQFLNFAGNQGTTFKNHGTGGGTSFTLDLQATTNSVLLAVGGVLQEPGVSYSVEGTTITTSSSVAAGIEVFSWILHKPGTAPVIQDNSVTGGKIALTSQAEGDIMYCNSAGDWVRLAKGTAGQVLTQNSGLTAPEWATASASGWEFVSSQSASASSTIDFTGFEAGYDYEITVHGLRPATDNTTLYGRYGTGETPTYQSSGYYYENTASRNTSAGHFGEDTGSAFRMNGNYGIGNATGEELGGIFTIINPGATDRTHTMWMFSHEGATATTMSSGVGGGQRQTDEAVTAFRFLMNSGNIAEGKFSLYRRANA